MDNSKVIIPMTIGCLKITLAIDKVSDDVVRPFKVLSALIDATNPETITFQKLKKQIVIEAGQVAISHAELAKSTGYNEKKVRECIKILNESGMIHSEVSHLISIHTINCLSGWIKGDYIKNPFCDETEEDL